MNDVREFHIGDLLSAYTGFMVSDRKMDGLYDILGFLTGENLFTHQLLQARDISLPYLEYQHPWLKDATPPEKFDSDEAVDAWVAKMIAKHGERHSLSKLPAMAWGRHDPMADLEAMVGKDRIITVELPDSEAEAPRG